MPDLSRGRDPRRQRGAEAPIRDELAERLAPLLTLEPKSLADLARAVGRNPQDGSVRNALKGLAKKGRAEKVEGGWQRPLGGDEQERQRLLDLYGENASGGQP